MAQYVGGLRDRLIRQSMVQRITNGLGAIGWLDAGRDHAPLDIIPEQKGWDVELAPNTITISPEDTSDEDYELGSYASKNLTRYYMDVYGQTEALGLQISGDIRDLLKGKFASLGFNGPELPVYDYTQGATPQQIFYCDIENVRRDRAQGYPKRWQRYLFIVSCEVIDYCGSDLVPETYRPL